MANIAKTIVIIAWMFCFVQAEIIHVKNVTSVAKTDSLVDNFPATKWTTTIKYSFTVVALGVKQVAKIAYDVSYHGDNIFSVNSLVGVGEVCQLLIDANHITFYPKLQFDIVYAPGFVGHFLISLAHEVTYYHNSKRRTVSNLPGSASSTNPSCATLALTCANIIASNTKIIANKLNYYNH